MRPFDAWVHRARQKRFNPSGEVAGVRTMWKEPSGWNRAALPSWALLASVILVMVAFTGCIGAMGSTSTGMTMEDPADERAQAWDAQASLVGVYGAEADQRHHQKGSGPYGPAGPGPQQVAAFNSSWGPVGDGQAPAWVYMYEAGDEGLIVVVDGNGTVIDEEETNASNQTPLQGWNVDSTDAVRTLQANDEDWARADPSTAMYGLMQESSDEDPFWFVAIMGEGLSAFGMVNATTGAYVESFTFDMGSGWGSWDTGGWEGNHSWDGSGSWDWKSGNHTPTEQGSFDGTLSPTNEDEEHTFDLKHDGHGVLDVRLVLADPATSTVTVTMQGPRGDETLEASPAQAQDEVTIEQPRPGSYTLLVELEEGAYQEYTLEWCAPGSDLSYGGGWGEDQRYDAC